MLARGWSNRRIDETCLLSLNTVRTHVQNVLVKLGVHSKLEAAALARAPRAGEPRRPCLAYLWALTSSITLAARWEGSSS
jgi:hypothetical protein